MKCIYLPFLILIPTFISAQDIHQREVAKDSAYLAIYAQMKDIRIKRLDSPEFKEYKKLMTAYAANMIHKFDEPESDVGTKAWLEDNWKNKTKFLSYESALRARDAVDAAGQLAFNNGAEYNQLMIKMIKLYGARPVADLEKEIMQIQFPQLENIEKD